MSTEAGKKDNSTFNLSLFLGKLLLSFATVYVGIAIGFAAFTPYDYSRRRSNFVHSFMTILSQPLYETLGSGKVSRWWDFEDVPAPNNSIILPASVRSNKANADNNFLTELATDLGLASEAAVLDPSGYTGQWSIVRCSGESLKNCRRSNILHKGRVKVLVNEPAQYWGQDKSGKWINIRVVEYINRNQQADLLLV